MQHTLCCSSPSALVGLAAHVSHRFRERNTSLLCSESSCPLMAAPRCTCCKSTHDKLRQSRLGAQSAGVRVKCETATGARSLSLYETVPSVP